MAQALTAAVLNFVGSTVFDLEGCRDVLDRYAALCMPVYNEMVEMPR